MEISELSDYSIETVERLNSLLFQLSPDIKQIGQEYLSEIVNSDNIKLFVARNNNLIVGTFTLVFYKIGSGYKASLEDVIVDDTYKGQHIGRRMVEYAIKFASRSGAFQLDLTSSPNRIAANALYQKLGFEKRETNVYRLKL